jgi:periplasmic protein TonB
MWSLPASLHLPAVALLHPRKSPSRNADHSILIASRASILGVGHFTVPPDVVEPAGVRPSSDIVAASWSTIGTIVVPHGIAAVPRRTPIKTRTRTPWHPVAETACLVERADSREWFADHVFVQSKQRHLPAACSTSATLHVIALILVLLFLGMRAARADAPPRVHMDVSLRMPAFLSLHAIAIDPPSARMPVESRLPGSRPAPPQARVIDTPTAAPLETPSSVEPEAQHIDAPPSDGALSATQEIGATADGVSGGVAGGSGNESPALAPTVTGPFRVGAGNARPRKIKDVRPIYPEPAMAARTGGSVLIEATIGTDGKVKNARVLHSAAAFDQAALDAVRQWEFEPSRINGEAVAVTMVIVVTFALL